MPSQEAGILTNHSREVSLSPHAFSCNVQYETGFLVGKHRGFFEFPIAATAAFNEPSVLVQISTVKRSLLLIPFVRGWCTILNGTQISCPGHHFKEQPRFIHVANQLELTRCSFWRNMYISCAIIALETDSSPLHSVISLSPSCINKLRAYWSDVVGFCITDLFVGPNG